MGMFSWIDVTGKENITDYDHSVTLLLPKEKIGYVEDFFGVKCDSRGFTGKYDGYGSIENESGILNICDVCAYLNIVLPIRNNDKYEMALLKKAHEVQREGSFSAWLDMVKGELSDTLMKGDFADVQKVFPDFREFGIHISCYDIQNAYLPVAIKLTVDPFEKYESSYISVSDPEQGFTKVRLSEKDEIERDIRNEKENEEENIDWDYIHDKEGLLYKIEKMEEKFNEYCEKISIEAQEFKSKQFDRYNEAMRDR